nr:methyltransferase domain-containing protein [Thiomicrorhabdus cannonii]
MFGYFLVQLGQTSTDSWLEASRVSHKLLLDENFDRSAPISASEGSQTPSQSQVHRIRADLDYLPLAKESVDVMVLPHTLETVTDPHYLLRQVDALLEPEGHLVITGFNPLACGVLKNRLKKHNRPLREAHLVSGAQLGEWLEVLGYEVEQVRFSTISCYEGTTSSDSLLGWRLLEKVENLLNGLGWQFGNVYCVVARKRVDAPRLVGLAKRRFAWPVRRPLQVAARGSSRTFKQGMKR